MKKPTVYLDTTIISAYWYEGENVVGFGRRLTTREWWESERHGFQIWISQITMDELEAGRYRRQREACEMARRLRVLPLNREIRNFTARLLSAGVVPEAKPNDAAQMAIAAVHRIDYLLTWNYAHLANPAAQLRLDEVCHHPGHRAPIMVSPESIPRATWGQQIRREDND